MIEPYPRRRTARHELMRRLNSTAREQPWGPIGVMRAVVALNSLLDLSTGGRYCLAIIDKNEARAVGFLLGTCVYTPTDAMRMIQAEGTRNDGLGD